MNIQGAVLPLGRIDDDELERLAATWHAQARYGDREAYGTAQALEVEHRWRLRIRQPKQVPAVSLHLNLGGSARYESGSGHDVTAFLVNKFAKTTLVNLEFWVESLR